MWAKDKAIAQATYHQEAIITIPIFIITVHLIQCMIYMAKQDMNVKSMYGSQDLGACVHSRPGDQEAEAWTLSLRALGNALHWLNLGR